VKIHCSVLAEDAIKAAIADWKKKKGWPRRWSTSPRSRGSMAEPSIHVTPSAAQQIKAQLARRAQTKPQSGVRLGVKGGGARG